MPPRTVEVSAPSRLHFGLFSFGGGERQFGGVGVVVEKPGLRLRGTTASAFDARGPLAGRVREFAERWATFHGLPKLPPCLVEVVQAPPDHVGLGTGTQLGLSVAAALNAFCEFPSSTPVELAISVGRGLRSAVGTYGFCGGGLVVERGKSVSDPISPLECRLDLPADWRFVLLTPAGFTGLSGSEEQKAFSGLPRVDPSVSECLIAEVRTRMVPAAARGDFNQFSESVYEFGRASGLCFSEKQGGPYNGPVLTALVESIRNMGVRGVGQSSWGPTIFAIFPNELEANRFVREFEEKWRDMAKLTMVVTPASNGGAKVEVRG